jgi:hypothetical protein
MRALSICIHYMAPGRDESSCDLVKVKKWMDALGVHIPLKKSPFTSITTESRIVLVYV